MKTNEGITFRLADGTVKDLETYIDEKTDFFETTETDCNKLPIVEGTFYNPNGFTTNAPSADGTTVTMTMGMRYVKQTLGRSGPDTLPATQECSEFVGAIPAVKFIRYYTPDVGPWSTWFVLPQSVAQETGNSTTSVMSQKAVTDAIPILFSKTGPSPSGGMTQKAITDELALKADLTAVLLKNGPDLVVGQLVSTLTNGKTYINCEINATLPSGSVYLYNCTGTVSVTGTYAKLYANNCPTLNITEKYFGAVIRDGVTLLYDKDSSYSSLNWGYPSGIKKASGTINKSFSPYKELIIYATATANAVGRVAVGGEGRVFSISGSGNYWGGINVYVTTTLIKINATKEIDITTSGSISSYENDSNFHIYKIYGVLK